MSITLYEHGGYKGRKVVLTDSNRNFCEIGFNDKASSIKVTSGTWILYEHANFQGKSYQVSQGCYDCSQVSAGVGNDTISSVKLVTNKITLFRDAGFKGTAVPLLESVPNFVSIGFNDEASSIKVEMGTWTVYEHVDYKGRSMQVTPGSYDIDKIHQGIGNDVISSVRLNTAEIVLYEHAGFEGRAVPITQSTPNLCDLNFNDKVSSIIVLSGTWSVFEHVDYQGKCHQFCRGSYDYRMISGTIGNDVISSIRLDSY